VDPSLRKALVIDASVAGSAGTSSYPDSIKCRHFLNRVLRVCHRLAFSHALESEWTRHASRFARRWLTAMTDRGKVERFQLKQDVRLRAEITLAARSDGERRKMLDDAHLIEAARHVNGPVASGDDKARNCFREATHSVRGLRAVVWVNPMADADRTLHWLNGGAQAEPDRCLGFGVED